MHLWLGYGLLIDLLSPKPSILSPWWSPFNAFSLFFSAGPHVLVLMLVYPVWLQMQFLPSKKPKLKLQVTEQLILYDTPGWRESPVSYFSSLDKLCGLMWNVSWSLLFNLSRCKHQEIKVETLVFLIFSFHIHILIPHTNKYKKKPLLLFQYLWIWTVWTEKVQNKTTTNKSKKQCVFMPDFRFL